MVMEMILKCDSKSKKIISELPECSKEEKNMVFNRLSNKEILTCSGFSYEYLKVGLLFGNCGSDLRIKVLGLKKITDKAVLMEYEEVQPELN